MLYHSLSIREGRLEKEKKMYVGIEVALVFNENFTS